jgi:hypothetical protein
MREYVVGYYNKVATKDDFVILATMDSKNVAMFVRDSYNEAYKRVGLTTEAVLLASHEVPKNYRFSE